MAAFSGIDRSVQMRARMQRETAVPPMSKKTLARIEIPSKEDKDYAKKQMDEGG